MTFTVALVVAAAASPACISAVPLRNALHCDALVARNQAGLAVCVPTANMHGVP